MNVEKLTAEQANAIFDILVQECGVRDDEYSRADFVMAQVSEYIREWRFSGNLEFGGKFRRDNGRLYVNCYREHETPERLEIIEKANKRLAAL